jgi:hypothetical protein
VWHIVSRCAKDLVEMGATSMHFAYYDFCRIHRTIRVTPSMEAGISDLVRDLSKLIRSLGEIQMGKYYPLERYLSSQKKGTLTLNFSAIEKIIGDKLPPSAFKHRAWWANDKAHVEALAWLNAGWSVQTVDESRLAVTFVSTL